MSLKPFVVFMSLIQSLMLLFVLDHVINAVYRGGQWGMAIVGSVFCALMLLPFVMGVRAVRQVGVQEMEPQPRADKAGFFCSASFAAMVVPVALQCGKVLHDTQIPLALKAVYVAMGSIFAAVALSHLGYAWGRWRKAGCPARLKTAVTHALLSLPANRSDE